MNLEDTVEADPTNADAAKPAMSPTALPIADAAKLLSRAGGQSISAAMLQADLSAGMPANADGTINLVHYAAWLVREMRDHD